MATRQKHRKRLKLRRLTAFLFAALLVNCAAGWLYLTSESGQAWLAGHVARLLESELGLEAHTDRVELRPLLYGDLLEIEAEQVILTHPQEGRFLSCEELRIRPSWSALLRGQVDLSTVELIRPQLRVRLRDGAIVNGPRTSDAPDTEPRIPVDHLMIQRAQVEIITDQGWEVSAGPVRIEGHKFESGAMSLAVVVPEAQVSFEGGEERFTDLELHGRIDPARFLEVEHLRAESANLRVDLRDGFLPLPFADTYRGAIRAQLNLGRLRQLPFADSIPPLDGIARLQADLVSEAGRLTGRGSVQLDQAVVEEQYGLGDVELPFVLNEYGVRIQQGQFHLVGDGGSVGVDGVVHFDESLRSDLELTLNEMHFHRLMQQLSVSDDAIVQWLISGTIRLAGTMNPLDLSGPLRLDTQNFLVTEDAWHQSPSQRVMGVSQADFRGQASVRPEGLRFSRLQIELPRSRLYGDCLLGFDNRLEVNARASTLDAADVAPLAGMDISGRGPVTVQVAGTFDDPRVNGTLDIRDFSFNEMRFGDVTSDWRMIHDGMGVIFPRVLASKLDSRYQMNELVLDFRRSRFLATAQILARRFTLADYYHLLGLERDERFEPFQGVTRGVVDFRFSHGAPDDGPTGTMVVDVDLDMPSSELLGYAFTDGHVRARWEWLDQRRGHEGAILTLHEFSAHKGAGSVFATGRMGLGATLQMSAVAQGIEIAETEGIGENMPQLRGIWGAVTDVSGTLSLPIMHIDLGLTGMRWGPNPIGDARFYVRHTHGRDPWIAEARDWDLANLPADEPCAAGRRGLARANWPADPPLMTVNGPQRTLDEPMAFVICGEAMEGQLGVDIAMGRSQLIPIRGAMTARELDLTHFLTDAGTMRPLTGQMSGVARIRGGGIDNFGGLAGDLFLSDFRVENENVDFANQGPVRATIDRGVVQITNATFGGRNAEISLSGGGSLLTGLDLRLEGNLDLALMSTVAPNVERADGLVNIRVNVLGPIDAPEVLGQASMNGGVLQFADFQETIRDVSGTVDFDSRRVVLRDATARLGGGTLGLSGEAQLRGRGLDGFSFEWNARNVGVEPESGMSFEFDGDGRLGWSDGHRLPRLTGTISLNRFEYSRAINLSPTLGELYRPRRADIDSYDPDADLVEIDLRIIGRRALRVNNNLGDAAFRIQDRERAFRIVGTNQRYGVLGNLSIPRGTIRLRNRDFAIREGVINFTDPDRIDPSFDVRAETLIRRSGDLTSANWRVALHAHGNRDAFRLDASSEPELSQEDLMLLLTLGMTRAEAERVQTGELTSTAALEALATVTGLDREIRRAVPVIDDFNIVSVYSPVTNRTEPHAAVGVRISERVRLNASTSIASESREFRSGVEWRLGSSSSVQAAYDNVNTQSSSFGNLGVDLQWRLEFE